MIHQIDRKWKIAPFCKFYCSNWVAVFDTLTLKEFSEKPKPFSENWLTVFRLKVLRLKAQHFHTKLTCKKPMLREIEWGVQNGPIAKNGVLPETILCFWTFWISYENWFDIPTTQISVFIYFSYAFEFYLRALFPCEYP